MATDTTAPQLLGIQQNQDVTLDVSSISYGLQGTLDYNPTDLGLSVGIIEDGSGVRDASVLYSLRNDQGLIIDSFRISLGIIPDANGYYYANQYNSHSLNQHLTSGTYELEDVSISD